MSLSRVLGDSRKLVLDHSAKKEAVKAGYLQERRELEAAKKEAQFMREERWKAKMERSPFHVDLVAEHERIDEENRMRLKEEARRQRLVEMRKEEVKKEIILQALSEQSDLEALRQEKRAIQLEERRLKALLDIEKAKAARAADRQAAARAERHRRQAKVEYRRDKYVELQKARDELEAKLLQEKHAVEKRREPMVWDPPSPK